ncbi:hypothetical protein B9Z55_022153 [Caenorhabditis nigoni]|uniref:PAN-3 domain-containing protein n=2 Tax=Caenorhabditis nigoni TaxID=1611254 RepID=A0A2G5TV35_9PELO|nr:hypothetical protein B9Z55_022153 [Caenorhabditis nigoni]
MVSSLPTVLPSMYLRSIFLYLLFVARVLSNDWFTLIVKFGKPVEFSGGFVSQDGSYSHQDCVNECNNIINCIVAHFDGSVCTIYEFGSVEKVQLFETKNANEILFKINYLGKFCPPEPLDPLPIVSEMVDEDFKNTQFQFTIDKDADGLLTFNYNTIRSCPPGFTKFTRPTGEYCLFLYANISESFTYSDAYNSCIDKYDAILSGLETEEERLFVAEQGRLANMNDTYAGNLYWISGYRKYECSRPEQLENPKCDGIEGFTQSDSHLTNKTGYKWAEGNLGTVEESGYLQSCIVLWTQRVEGVLHGLTDDATCTMDKTRYAAARGFLCGKEAGR